MKLHLEEKVAVVTGAGRGIGKAVAAELVDAGCRVVTGARSRTPPLDSSALSHLPVDLGTPEGPGALVEHALAEFGDIGLVVNNVGGGAGGGEATETGFSGVDDGRWAAAFELNLFSAVRTTRAALPSLLRGGGSIVNISSNAARMPHAGPVQYTTAKAALTALGAALAEEFGSRGVRVNTVSPGPVHTDLWAGSDGYGARLAARRGLEHEELLERLPSMMGMTTGRLVQPEDVAALTAFLASPHAAGINGADFIVDGGALKTA